MITSNVTPFPFPDFWTVPGYKKNRLYIGLNADSEYIQPCGKPSLRCAKYYHLTDAVIVFSKEHSTVQSSQFLQDAGEHGKTSKFHVCQPTVTVFAIK